MVDDAGNRILLVAQKGARGMLQIAQNMGQACPIRATATGKALQANCAADQQESILDPPPCKPSLQTPLPISRPCVARSNGSAAKAMPKICVNSMKTYDALQCSCRGFQARTKHQEIPVGHLLVIITQT